MKLSLLILLSLGPLLVKGQTGNLRIDSYYDSLPFVKIVDEIEKEHSVRFYFSKQLPDSIIVKQKESPVTLTTLLEGTFKDSGFDYLIDGPHILVTENYKIRTSLPEDFFMVNLKDKNNLEYEDLRYAFIEQAPIEENNHNDVITIGDPANRHKGKTAILSGVIRNEEDGEPVIGGVVYVKEIEKGTTADVYGYYVINLPKGQNEILFKYVGRKDTKITVLLNDNGTLNIDLEKDIIYLREVVVTADKESHVKNMNMGMQVINIETVKQIPSSFGEADIIKSAILLPGVQTVGEAASGFNVRGGSTDQNLILLDGAPIFNTSHLFGFFSVFNTEVIKDFALYKSGIPARYGGRVSSVFDVSMKQGNRKNFAVSGGVSPITGKLTLEGPLIKDKASFIIGGRSTYSDWLMKRIDRPEFRNSNASFYDINAKFNYDINNKNSLSIMAYQSADWFKLNSDTAYNYENTSASLLFRRSFTERFYGSVSAIYSNYQYNILSDKTPVTSFNMKHNIAFRSVKTEFNYLPDDNHKLNLGAEIIRYDITPVDFTPLLAESDIIGLKLPKEQGIECGFFISDEFTVTNRLTLSAGFRYALFYVLGPAEVYKYRSDAPRSIDSRVDSTQFSTNEVIKTYGGPETRFSARYRTGLNNSVKMSYNRMYQFTHMLTNSTSISPTDVWKISDANIKPTIGDQVALGFYQNLANNTIESSVEVYYKWTKNNLDYKSGICTADLGKFGRSGSQWISH